MRRKKPPSSLFHISWFNDPGKMNLRDPLQKREWIQMVLTRGRSKDIRKLNPKEVAEFLPRLRLPPETKRLWKNILSHHK